MRNRTLRLAVVAAVTFVVPTARSSAQPLGLPSRLTAAPACEVPDRLLAGRSELALTETQAANLAALSAELHTQEKLWHASSKPWVAAARRSSPQQALDRALETLSPAQRASAVRLLASTGEVAR
jgi:hypothetical protein